MPEIVLLIGLGLVALVASGLALTPPTRVGVLASFIRIGAACLLVALGVFLETRGLTLPALIVAGAGGYLFWRQRNKGRRPAGEGTAPGAAAGQMSLEEAYAVLGLAPGAGEQEIRRAHHDLIQKMHPDRGGTSYLAAKLNIARDTLLKNAR